MKGLDDVKKQLGEIGTVLKAVEQNDPAQQKTTETEGNIQAIAQASGDSAVASNLKSIHKATTELRDRLKKQAEELAALVKDSKGEVADEARAAIEKAGAATSKLNEITELFKIDTTKLRDEYDLRWKVSELVCALQQAAKLEEILDAPAEKAETKKSDTWPRDMGAAKFDEKAGVYKSDVPSWGSDSTKV